MRIATSLRQLTLAAALFAATALVAGPAAAKAPTPTVSCQGAVIYVVNATQNAAPACIAVGGIVRIENLGPGELTATPTGWVDCFYAAGVHSCRLIHAGNVRFSWSSGSVQRQLAVRVAAAARPTQPAPACVPAGETYSIDTNDEMRWWSLCLKVGATLRVVNLGPGELAVNPRAAVSCYYEGGVHVCRIVAPATITFSTATRTQLVVAIA